MSKKFNTTEIFRLICIVGLCLQSTVFTIMGCFVVCEGWYRDTHFIGCIIEESWPYYIAGSLVILWALVSAVMALCLVMLKNKEK